MIFGTRILLSFCISAVFKYFEFGTGI